MDRYTAEELEQLYVEIFGENEMTDRELEENLRRVHRPIDTSTPFTMPSLYDERTPLRYSTGTGN